MDPEYQRGHVWTESQQVAYLEYRARGGEAGSVIMTNLPGWMSDFRGPYEMVDGKQRVEAARRFMRDEIRIFGHLHSEFDDSNAFWSIFFDWRVFNLEKREDILKLYLDINAGGTPHATEEIERVRELLKKERCK